MSSDLNLSDDVATSLRKYGWTPERKVDTAEWERNLEADGFSVSLFARQVLQQFGGLSIDNREPLMAGAKYASAKRITFPALDAPARVSTSRRLELLVGSTICPVAELNGGDGFIFVTEDGRWILGTGGYSILGGDSDSALRNLLYGTAGEIQWIWQ